MTDDTRLIVGIILKFIEILNLYVQFSPVAQSCPTLCDPMDCNTPGLPVPYGLLEFALVHVH